MTEARKTLDATISERDWQDCIMSLLRAHNWLCFHAYDSRRSQPGFPDLLCIRGWRILAIELKTETGKLTPAQQEWLAAFDQTGHAEAYVWRPSDWDTVERVLR